MRGLLQSWAEIPAIEDQQRAKCEIHGQHQESAQL